MPEEIPFGAYRGKPNNPWMYLSPEAAKEAERRMIEIGHEQGAPRAMGTPYKYLNLRNEMPYSERKYQSWQESGDDWLQSNVVNPLTKKGYPTLGAGAGAIGAAARDVFVPGPEGWGFGMAGGGKKIETLWDYLSPEAREAAKLRHKELREVMAGKDVPEESVIDPYAKTDTGPYGDLKKYEDFKERQVDPYTGVERRAEERPFTEEKVDAKRSAEDAARQRKIDERQRRAKLSFRERMDEDIEEYWEDQWSIGNLDEDIFSDDYYRSEGDIYTRGDELERIQDRLRYNDEFKKEISEKIYGNADPNEKELNDWLKKNYPEDLEEMLDENGDYNAWRQSHNEKIKEWADEQADEYIDDKIKELEPTKDDWDEELEYYDPIEWDENYDWDNAPFGEEKIYDYKVRERRFRKGDFRNQREMIKNVTDGDTADEITESVYRHFIDDFFDENAESVWESQFDYDWDSLLDKMPSTPKDTWTESDVADAYWNNFEEEHGGEKLLDEIEKHLGSYKNLRSKHKMPEKEFKELVKKTYDTIWEERKRAFKKGFDHRVDGIEGDLIEELKDMVDD